MDLKRQHWTKGDIALLEQELKETADPTFQVFHQRLVPGVTNLLGVRIPVLRDMAKQIAKGNWQEYLSNTKTEWYEETMLYGLVIGYIKTDIETRLSLVREFVPRIDNWAVCDSCCSGFKFVEKNRERVYDFLGEYLASDQEYELRFAVIMLMDYFITPDYLDRLFLLFDSIRHEGYYVKMTVAWALSVCFVKFEGQTTDYLRECRLDDVTYNKALQKIIESNRVDKRTKDRVRKMKRKPPKE